ncbi:MAG: hypothetical protein Q9222_000714 [Ikaeria aurantiellina]
MRGSQILDTSTEFIFGESANTLTSNSSLDAQQFLQAFDDAVAGVGKRVMLGRVRYLVRDQEWKAACTIVHEYCDKHVAAALRERDQWSTKPDVTEVDRWVLLRELAKETQDAHDLRCQILNVFSPGRDSTGILLSNIFFFVSRQPSKWTRIRREVLSVEDRLLDYETLNSLTFINYCLKESLSWKIAIVARRRDVQRKVEGIQYACRRDARQQNALIIRDLE